MVPSSPRRHGRCVAIVLILLAAGFTAQIVSAPPVAAAGTHYLSGSACAGNTTPYWVTGDTWIMTGNVTVPVGCILTIQPGVVVRGNVGTRLFIDGGLQANGTSTSYISFDTNLTNRIWGGIQFNKSSRGSYLQYASLHLVDRGVRAIGNPLFWGPTLYRLNIDHALIGVEFQGSNGTLSWSRINATTMGIRASDGGFGGYPIFSVNTITTVLSNPAIGIYGTNLVAPTFTANTIMWVNGTDGANGGALGTNGQDGGPAVGILVNGGGSPNVAGNTIDHVNGGRGGNGGTPVVGNGGLGGKGGDASAIVMANAQNSRAQTNDIYHISGGHGGAGGAASGPLFAGGPGGSGGTAIGMEGLNNSVTGWWFYNDAVGMSGGSGGEGGSGGTVGIGGAGGAAYGHFFLQNNQANASNNLASNLHGGYGGNGSVGGRGGEVGGVWLGGFGGSAIVGTNNVTGLTGGQGGAGNKPVAVGGNATAILVIGDPKTFNMTILRNNVASTLTGGIGGVGGLGGSNGGSVTGVGAVYVRLVSSGNSLRGLTGGQGGSTGPGQVNGAGGSATGFAMAILNSSASLGDRFQSIAGGLPGSGGTAPPRSQGVGAYVAGNRTLTQVASLTNDTFASVADYDLFLENYTRTTSLNTTFASSKLYVGSAANLTVQNYLTVKVLWPNNVTAVPGARIVVKDNGVEAYNRTSPLGTTRWIVVTNRVYIDSRVAIWNTTQVGVSYLTYTFGNNPRTVNLTASQTQYFTMVDTTPPTSSASALPAWTTTRTFNVRYTYADGFGVGVKNITLWYRLNGTLWVAYGTQNATALGSGTFSFTASTDGEFEFATTAIDKANNGQPAPPTANNTWTIVDTTKPTSQVSSLPTYETSLSFTVTWGPGAGTADIAQYAIQYNATSTWQTWMVVTYASSATFTATSQGVYAFRSIARDYAGNTEVKSGNDTWTVVDSVTPTSTVAPLPAYETNLTFTVSWGPTAGTADIVNYTIQVSTDGGAWVAWLSGVTSTSASFVGADGHRYAFRSLARDYAGNVEAKAGNDTWTIVDTSPPTSAVAGLPAYETSLSFLVSWSPTAGVTDVASYRVEYLHGGAWVAWFNDTTATSATFNIPGLGITSTQGAYAFRSIATDRAGLVESKTANDTWTVVDTIVPTSSVAALPTYETVASFPITWGPTGLTADVASYTLQVSTDGNAWRVWFSGATNQTATFSAVSGHRYAFRSLARDSAGNVETKMTNDTWTAVDTTAPTSAVNGLPRYETSVTFQVNWGPTGLTTDVASYDLQVSLDGGGWTTWLPGVTNRSAIFTGTDGHLYAFRSKAVDRAGNLEAKSGNDTWTTIDASIPSILYVSPEGAGVAAGSTITVTFSEPMDEASAQLAFSLSPTVDGSFSWNAAGTVLTFTPSRPLAAGSSYTVVISTSARDLGGNALGAVKTFTFTTTGSSSASSGFALADLWPVFVAIAAAAGVAVLLLRRRGAAQEAAAQPASAAPVASSGAPTEIDDVFLLYKDGILIKHETLRLRPDVDTDILSGMLTAVQQFVKDSFQSEDDGELNEITVGQMHLHIGRGKWLILAARLAGGDVATMNEQIRKCIQDMEDHHWDQLEDWDGDMGLAKILAPYLKRLIRGEYV